MLGGMVRGGVPPIVGGGADMVAGGVLPGWKTGPC